MIWVLNKISVVIMNFCILPAVIVGVLIVLIIFFVVKIYRNSNAAKRKRGFYRLDSEKMYQEEYNDRVALRNFNSKDQLLSNEYHDVTDSESENEVMFNRTLWRQGNGTAVL